MLVIRDEQMHVFAEAFDARFFRDLVGWTRAAWFDQAVGRSDAVLERLLREAASRAVSFGVTREDDVRAFVDLELRLGPGFEHKLPYALGVLRDATLSGGAKVALLQQRSSAAP